MQPNLTTTVKLCILLFVTIAHFCSCSSTKKVPFNNSTVVPGAEGTVKVKKDKNKNYLINVNVDNLPDSKKLTPSKETYVVWIETPDAGVKNVGQVKSSSSMFSKARKASISTVSTSKPKRVFVTAENDGTITAPGTQTVLTTETFGN